MSKKQNQSIIRKMISITIVALILGAVCFLGGVLLAQRSHSGKTTGEPATPCFSSCVPSVS